MSTGRHCQPASVVHKASAAEQSSDVARERSYGSRTASEIVRRRHAGGSRSITPDDLYTRSSGRTSERRAAAVGAQAASLVSCRQLP
jgi:hypothetical protein